MALFKISRGNSATLPSTMTDGWAYFCTDTGEFFIDYADSNGTLRRKQINADEAKKITGYDISTVLNDSNIEIPTSSAVLNKIAGHTNNSDIHVTADDKASWNETIYLQNIDVVLPSVDNWTFLSYCKDKFIASVTDGYVGAYSINGIDWTEIEIPISQMPNVVYGNGKFVAVGSGQVTLSDDGVIWSTAQSTLPSSKKTHIAYGKNKFVVVFRETNICAYSSDALTWSQSTLPSSKLWNDLTYGNGRFVAVAANTTTAIYSDDGVNWNTSALPSSKTWTDVSYGNGKFVAIARETDVFAYSEDGMTWISGTMPSSQSWISLSYGNGKFVAIAMNSDVVAYSNDGINWTQSVMPITNYWICVSYGNGKFVSTSNSSNAVACSYDGINWFTSTNILETVSGNIVTSDVKNALGFGTKADASAVYTQSEVDALIAAVKDACMPKFTTVTISSDEWSYDSSEYYYDVVLDCLTSNTQVNLQADASSLSILQDDGIALTPVCYSSYVRIWTIGGAPREDITVQMTIQQVMEV